MVTMVIRLLIAGISILPHATTVSISIGVIALGSIVHFLTQPYKRKFENRAEFLSYLIILSTIGVQTSVSDTENIPVILLIAHLVNGLFVIWMAISIIITNAPENWKSVKSAFNYCKARL